VAAGDLALTLLISAQDNASAVIMGISTAIGQLASGNVLGAVALGAAAVGAAMVGAAKDAGNFETSMNQLVTSAGEAQGNLKAVSDGILKISVDTGTSTDQLAKGMYYIESSGHHGADGLNVLRVAAEGAKSENADLTTVSKALTTVMTDYHLPVNDATAAMNGLIATVQNGKTNLADLSSSMGQVLPVASSLGISFPQVAGAMATMTNAGMSSRQAAMNLAHVLVALEAPSGVATKSMQQVGLSAQQVRDALVSQGLPAALQLIEDHVGKKFPAGSVEAETALKNIMGGLVGLKTAAQLTGGSLQTTEDNVKKITAAMNDASKGVLGWDLVQTSFNFKLDQAKAAFSALMITLGTELLPIFGKVVGWVTQAVEAFTQWESKTHMVEAALNVVVTAIGFVVDGLGKLGDVVGQVVSAFAPSFDALSKAATTWGQNFANNFAQGVASLVGSIISIVEQIGVAIEDYLGFKSPTRKGPGSRVHTWGPNLVKTLASGMIASVSMIDSAVDTVASRLATVQGGQGTGQTLIKGLAASGNMTTNLSSGLKSGAGAVGSAVNAVGSQLHALCSTHAKAASTCASTTLTHGLATSMKANAHHVATAASHVGAQTKPVATHAQTHAATAHHALTTGLASKIKASAPAVAGAASNLADMIKHPMDQIPASANKAAQGIAQAFQQHLSPIASFVKGIMDKVAAAFKQAFTAMTPGLVSIWHIAQEQLIPALKGLWNTIEPLVALLGQLAAWVGKTIVAFAKWLTQASTLKSMWDGFVVAMRVVIAIFSTLINVVSKTLQPVIAQLVLTFKTQLAPAFTTLWHVIQPLLPIIGAFAKIIGGVLLVVLGLLVAALAAVLQGLAGLLAGVIRIFGGIVQIITGAFTVIGGITVLFVDLFTGHFDRLGKDLKSIWDGIVQMLTGVAQIIEGIFQGLWGFLSGAISGFVTTIIDYFTNLYNALVGHSIIPNIVNGIISWFNKLISFIPNLIRQIISTLVNGWNTVQRDVTTAWQKISTIFSSAWATYISRPLTSLVSSISSWATGLATNFGTWATNMMKMFGTNITNGLHFVTDAATQVALKIKSILGIASPAQSGPLATADQWMPNLMKMFSQQIAAGTPAITAKVTALATQVQQKITQMSTDVQTAVTTLMGKLATVGTQLQTVTTQVNQGIQTLTTKLQSAAITVQTTIQTMTTQVNSAVTGMKSQIVAIGTTLTAVQNSVTATLTALNNQIQKSVAAAQQGVAAAQGAAVGSADFSIQASTSATTAAAQAAQADASSQQAQQAVQDALQRSDDARAAANAAAQANQQANQSVQDALQKSDNARAAANAAAQARQKAQQAVQDALQRSDDARTAARASAAFADNSNASAANAAFGAGSSADFSMDAAKSASSAASSAKQASESHATALVQLTAIQGIVAQAGSIVAQIAGMAASAASQAAGMVASAQSAASQVAALLGHSKPKEGPLKDDDKWGEHMMDNITRGIRKGIPRMSDAVEDALEALKNLHGGGTGGIVLGTSITTTANIRGDIPVSYVLPPPAQPMVIYNVLDGKTIGKCVTNYQAKELRVQGIVRSH